MKVLHVNKFLYRRGGAESYMLDVAAMQQQAGHEVAFFGMEHPENPPQRYAAQLPPRLEFEPPPSGIVSKARLFGRMLHSTSARAGMAEVADDFAPDVVHLHNIYHQLSPSILQPLAARGIPSVMTLHDYKLACPTYQLLDRGKICTACVDDGFRQAVRRRCRAGSLAASGAMAAELALHTRIGAYDPVGVLVSPSRFLSRIVSRANDAYRDRLAVLDHFIDLAALPPRHGAGAGVVFAGRLSAEKGVDTLIEAVGRMRPAASLDIAGDGPERGQLELLAAVCAPGRVTFHGRLDKTAVLRLLAAAAVAVVPSRWYENQPMSVLEAFGCATPVVASDLGGLPELIESGETGLLVPHDDADALANALGELVADPVRRSRMGQRARALAATRFAPDRHLSGLQQLYARAADRTPAVV